MAGIVLAAGAAYVGYKAAQRVRSAYSSAKQEMIEEQELANYYNQPDYYYAQQYNYPPYSRGSSGYHHHRHHHHSSGYPYSGGHSPRYNY